MRHFSNFKNVSPQIRTKTESLHNIIILYNIKKKENKICGETWKRVCDLHGQGRRDQLGQDGLLSWGFACKHHKTGTNFLGEPH